jgi:hypothetical protein
LSLHKDALVPRAVQAVGRILRAPILGGLYYTITILSLRSDLIPRGTGENRRVESRLDIPRRSKMHVLTLPHHFLKSAPRSQASLASMEQSVVKSGFDWVKVE